MCSVVTDLSIEKRVSYYKQPKYKFVMVLGKQFYQKWIFFQYEPVLFSIIQIVLYSIDTEKQHKNQYEWKHWHYINTERTMTRLK